MHTNWISQAGANGIAKLAEYVMCEYESDQWDAALAAFGLFRVQLCEKHAKEIEKSWEPLPREIELVCVNKSRPRVVLFHRCSNCEGEMREYQLSPVAIEVIEETAEKAPPEYIN